MDIHKGFGNANKLMSRLLYDGFDHFGLRVVRIDGGSLRNAIPRVSMAVVVVDAVHKDAFESDTEHLISAIEKEFDTIEPELKIVLNYHHQFLKCEVHNGQNHRTTNGL